MAGNLIRFDDRAILITGAGRGLGRSYALLLASRGAKIVVADNGVAMDGSAPSAGPASEVAAEIVAAGGEAIACTSDLSTEEGATAAVEATVEAFGRIDGLLHNASTVPTPIGILEQDRADFDKVMHINPFASQWMARTAWPHMERQGYGRIVLTTSTGIYGGEGTGPYCAAKAANIGLMRCLAPEGQRNGILVNVVAPSANTRMTQSHLPPAYAQWLATTMGPERVSPGVAYLVSEACDVTGEVVVIAGGRIARIAIAESAGILVEDSTIEAVRDLMPQIMADDRYIYPRTNAERKALVYEQLGSPRA